MLFVMQIANRITFVRSWPMLEMSLCPHRFVWATIINNYDDLFALFSASQIRSPLFVG